MKTQHLALVLAVINLVILIFVLTHLPTGAVEGVVPVLRGRSLEIVDDQGKLRAQIIIAPPTTMAGKSYPETVLFRLIDPNGRPAVKMDASVSGSGVDFSGDSERTEWSGVQILANGTASTMKLINKDGREQIVTP